MADIPGTYTSVASVEAMGKTVSPNTVLDETAIGELALLIADEMNAVMSANFILPINDRVHPLSYGKLRLINTTGVIALTQDAQVSRLRGDEIPVNVWRTRYNEYLEQLRLAATLPDAPVLDTADQQAVGTLPSLVRVPRGVPDAPESEAEYLLSVSDEGVASWEENQGGGAGLVSLGQVMKTYTLDTGLFLTTGHTLPEDYARRLILINATVDARFKFEDHPIAGGRLAALDAASEGAGGDGIAIAGDTAGGFVADPFIGITADRELLMHARTRGGSASQDIWVEVAYL